MTPVELEIRLNGRPATIEAGTTVAALLARLGADRAGTAVAINEEIVRRDRHEETTLNSGDRVEVIQAVGGG